MLEGKSELCLQVKLNCVWQVKALKDTLYKDLEFQVTSVLQKIETLQQHLSLVIQDRRWRERDVLIVQRNDLVKFFQEHVRVAVSQRFQEQEVDTVDVSCLILIKVITQ